MILIKLVCLCGLVLLGETLAQTTTSIFVGFGFIANFDASIEGSSGGGTTYVLSCPTANPNCNGLIYGLPSLTVTAGLSTVTYSASTSNAGSVQETSRVCTGTTGTGSTVTAGLCTIYSVQGPNTVSFVQTLSPDADAGAYYQTVILAGASSGSVSPSTSTSNTASSATTGSQPSSSTPTQTAATKTAASTSSKNAARKTDSPWPILAGAGALAAVIGL